MEQTKNMEIHENWKSSLVATNRLISGPWIDFHHQIPLGIAYNVCHRWPQHDMRRNWEKPLIDLKLRCPCFAWITHRRARWQYRIIIGLFLWIPSEVSSKNNWEIRNRNFANERTASHAECSHFPQLKNCLSLSLTRRVSDILLICIQNVTSEAITIVTLLINS